MSTHSDTEKHLPLPQLVSALNQELQRVAYSPPFTFDEVSQLEKDISTALVNVREWRNSFVPANRIPLDVLPLIPTHLVAQKDRFRASFVCRNWRTAFLHRADLWSELFLSKGETYVKTILGRAKGRTALDVFVDHPVSVSTTVLLSACAAQIRCLDFSGDSLENIRRLLEVDFGPLPLLHTLAINASEDDVDSAPPSQPLLKKAVDLKVLRFHSGSWSSQSLTHFVFPNLVSIDFLATPSESFYTTPQLLDFLEASPMLRTVQITIVAGITCNVPDGRIAVLPNVESFNLIVSNDGDGYLPVVVHISCPSWNEMVSQYTRSPVEEIAVEIKTSHITTSKLTFRSGDATVIELCYERADEDKARPRAVNSEVLTAATETVQDHPQLANVNRLRVCHNFRRHGSPKLSDIASEIGNLFKSVGPLDELTIYHCNLRPYLHPFLTSWEDDVEQPVAFPQTKELTFSNPLGVSGEECQAIVKLAKSQHASGRPFERVVFHGGRIFEGMEQKLRRWVGSVAYHYEELHDGSGGDDDDDDDDDSDDEYEDEDDGVHEGEDENLRLKNMMMMMMMGSGFHPSYGRW